MNVTPIIEKLFDKPPKARALFRTPNYAIFINIFSHIQSPVMRWIEQIEILTFNEIK